MKVYQNWVKTEDSMWINLNLVQLLYIDNNSIIACFGNSLEDQQIIESFEHSEDAQENLDYLILSRQ